MRYLRSKGFTLIELIVIITIIGVLITMSFVFYGNYRNRAFDAAVQSDLEAISSLLESFRQDPVNSDKYPQTTVMLATAGIKASKSSYNTANAINFVYCLNTSSDPTLQHKAYALVAESRSGNLFMMTHDGFKTATTTHASMIAGTTCSGLSLGLISNGMAPANTWQSWVGNG